jgi:DNA-binding transcriptional ArsR family regulator
MQRLVIVFFFLVVISSVRATAPSAVALDFSSPATFQGRTTVFADWALLVFDESDGLGNFSFAGTETEYHQLAAIGEEPFLHQDLFVPMPTRRSIPHEFEGSGQVKVSGAPASILVVGQVQVSLLASLATIRSHEGGTCLNSHFGAETNQQQAARYEDQCLQARVSFRTTPTGLTLNASQLSLVEFHNLKLECKYRKCPTYDDRQETQTEAGVKMRELIFHRIEPAQGSLALTTSEALVVLGGEEVTIDLDGYARLPLAHADCGGCGTNATTWMISGPLHFEALTSKAPNRLAGTMSGSVVSLRLDEQTVDPSLVGTGVWTTATIGALVVLKFLVAPFFTRLTKEQALEHPRRRRIFEYIQENPGANFREVARRTGIAAGTVRHHLNVLARSDIIAEHQHGSTVRLFENLSKFQANWADHVLLREPSLGELYDWLKANPGAPQKAVLEGMEPQGWSRSTTQHRLSRLVDGGLATIRLQGRLKIYTALDRSSNPPAPS